MYLYSPAVSGSDHISTLLRRHRRIMIQDQSRLYITTWILFSYIFQLNCFKDPHCPPPPKHQVCSRLWTYLLTSEQQHLVSKNHDLQPWLREQTTILVHVDFLLSMLNTAGPISASQVSLWMSVWDQSSIMCHDMYRKIHLMFLSNPQRCFCLSSLLICVMLGAVPMPDPRLRHVIWEIFWSLSKLPSV